MIYTYTEKLLISVLHVKYNQELCFLYYLIIIRGFTLINSNLFFKLEFIFCMQ